MSGSRAFLPLDDLAEFHSSLVPRSLAPSRKQPGERATRILDEEVRALGETPGFGAARRVLLVKAEPKTGQSGLCQELADHLAENHPQWSLRDFHNDPRSPSSLQIERWVPERALVRCAAKAGLIKHSNPLRNSLVSLFLAVVLTLSSYLVSASQDALKEAGKEGLLSLLRTPFSVLLLAGVVGALGVCGASAVKAYKKAEKAKKGETRKPLEEIADALTRDPLAAMAQDFITHVRERFLSIAAPTVIIVDDLTRMDPCTAAVIRTAVRSPLPPTGSGRILWVVLEPPSEASLAQELAARSALPGSGETEVRITVLEELTRTQVEEVLRRRKKNQERAALGLPLKSALHWDEGGKAEGERASIQKLSEELQKASWPDGLSLLLALSLDFDPDLQEIRRSIHSLEHLFTKKDGLFAAIAPSLQWTEAPKVAEVRQTLLLAAKEPFRVLEIDATEDEAGFRPGKASTLGAVWPKRIRKGALHHAWFLHWARPLEKNPFPDGGVQRLLHHLERTRFEPERLEEPPYILLVLEFFQRGIALAELLLERALPSGALSAGRSLLAALQGPDELPEALAAPLEKHFERLASLMLKAGLSTGEAEALKGIVACLDRRPEFRGIQQEIPERYRIHLYGLKWFLSFSGNPETRLKGHAETLLKLCLKHNQYGERLLPFVWSRLADVEECLVPLDRSRQTLRAVDFPSAERRDEALLDYAMRLSTPSGQSRRGIPADPISLFTFERLVQTLLRKGEKGRAVDLVENLALTAVERLTATSAVSSGDLLSLAVTLQQGAACFGAAYSILGWTVANSPNDEDPAKDPVPEATTFAREIYDLLSERLTPKERPARPPQSTEEVARVLLACQDALLVRCAALWNDLGFESLSHHGLLRRLLWRLRSEPDGGSGEITGPFASSLSAISPGRTLDYLLVNSATASWIRRRNSLASELLHRAAEALYRIDAPDPARLLFLNLSLTSPSLASPTHGSLVRLVYDQVRRDRSLLYEGLRRFDAYFVEYGFTHNLLGLAAPDPEGEEHRTLLGELAADPRLCPPCDLTPYLEWHRLRREADRLTGPAALAALPAWEGRESHFLFPGVLALALDKNLTDRPLLDRSLSYLKAPTRPNSTGVLHLVTAVLQSASSVKDPALLEQGLDLANEPRTRVLFDTFTALHACQVLTALLYFDPNPTRKERHAQELAVWTERRLGETTLEARVDLMRKGHYFFLVEEYVQAFRPFGIVRIKQKEFCDLLQTPDPSPLRSIVAAKALPPNARMIVAVDGHRFASEDFFVLGSRVYGAGAPTTAEAGVLRSLIDQEAKGNLTALFDVIAETRGVPEVLRHIIRTHRSLLKA